MFVGRGVLAALLLVWPLVSCPMGQAAEGKVHGVAKYEKVPYQDPKTGKPGLQRNNPKIRPIIGARVELVSEGDNKVLGSTITGKDGNYQIPWKSDKQGNAFVRVWARAENAEIRDFFTSPDQLARSKKPIVSPTVFAKKSKSFPLAANVAQDVLAQEKDGMAGVFNILECIRLANDFLRKVEPTIVFPPVKIYWALEANPFTSHFRATEKEKAAFILGIRDKDSDEFDDCVLLHEYGHFLMKVFSRDDSPGGDHTGGQKADPRLAFGEGFANFFSAAVLGDPRYVDTRGKEGQGQALIVDMDNPKTGNPGYWNEHTVASVLWNIIDKRPGDFHMGVPFKDVWDVVRGSWAKSPCATLANFCDMLLQKRPDLAPQLDRLLATHAIQRQKGKTLALSNSTFHHPYSVGKTVQGAVDSLTHRYRHFDGLRIYTFDLAQKTHVKIQLDLLHSKKPDQADLDLFLYDTVTKGQVAASVVEDGTDLIEKDLEPGKYFVEVRSWSGNNFNTGTYRLVAAVGPEDPKNKVFLKITPAQLQTILKDLGYTFTPRESGAAVTLGDKFQTNLESFAGGTTLVIGCNDFKKVSVARINQWNDEKSLSRAIARPDVSRLEADLDCELGVTPQMVHRFLQRYRRSLTQFGAFIAQTKD
jgi:hypothetical protein